MIESGATCTCKRTDWARACCAAGSAWAIEPPSKLNALLKLDNVVATPHIAAGTLPPENTFEAILPNILAALRGEPITALITPQATPEERDDETPDDDDQTKDEVVDDEEDDTEETVTDED